MRPPRWLRGAAYAAGLGLLAGAVAVVWSRREALERALDAALHPAPLDVAILALGVAANVVLSGLVFSALLARSGRVGLVEMQALIAAASLANFLPLRPGLFGRLAWHRLVNGIPVAAVVRSIVAAIALTAAVAAYLLALVLASGQAPALLWAGALAPLPLLAAGALSPVLRLWALAGLCRYVEVLVWALRYGAAFSIIGRPIEPSAALGFAAAGVLANAAPFVGNGLGVREWAIGLLAPLLTAHQIELGVTAELVNRGAEVLVIAGLGLAGFAWLARARRRHAAAGGRPLP